MRRLSHRRLVQDGPGQRIWLVFGGEADQPWLRLLKPGFRHCFAAVADEAGWLVLEPLSGRLLVARLPVPDFEFAIIAGAAGDETGWNPLIPGDDDGTISVDCTRLAGASDFITFRSQHSFMMDDKPVIAATLRFLETGALRETGVKQPIPAVTPPPPPAIP